MKSFYDKYIELFFFLSVICAFSTATTDVCGESKRRATDDTQILTSPNFPQSYPKNTTCNWRIYTRYHDSNIHIKIKQLDLEHSSNCEKDSLTIYQHYERKELVVKLCGNGTYDESLELGKDVNIVLETDDDVEGTGFLIEYYMDEDDSRERDDHHKKGYSDHWFTALIVVFVVILVALTATIAIACFFQRKQARAKKQPNFNDIQSAGNGSSEDLFKTHI